MPDGSVVVVLVLVLLEVLQADSWGETAHKGSPVRHGWVLEGARQVSPEVAGTPAAGRGRLRRSLPSAGAVGLFFICRCGWGSPIGMCLRRLL